MKLDNSNIYQNMRFAKDECYTTRVESDKLVGYITKNNLVDKNSIIWCPFDNELSNIYKSLIASGYKVELSNLELGLDFYTYEPKKWDLIITNPPFSGRTDLIKRLLSFKKPFIILQASQMFNNQTLTSLLCEYSNSFKFIFPKERMNFMTYNEKENKVKSSNGSTAFYSFWLAYRTNLQQTFNTLASSGKEKEVEEFDINGNAIKDNHFSLFSLLN